MNLLVSIYVGLLGLPHIIKSKHSFKNKVLIFFIWIKINIKFLLLSKIFNIKSEKFFGYKIKAFNYSSIVCLFGDIFFKNEYFFVSNNKKPIIFDCGANIGFATIFFKWLYPESEIYAFEPDKKTFELLKYNIEYNNLKNVHLFNVALSRENGTLDFFIDCNNPGSLIMSTKKERISTNKILVNCISLSSFMTQNKITKIDFVKMDIEGSEKEVVDDLDTNETLLIIDKLIIEYHHKINTYKSDLGWFLARFEKNNFEYQINANCIPVSSEDKFQDILIYFYKK